MSSFPFKTFLAALLASSCFVPVAQATTITWGGSTGDWFTATNWTGGVLPASADTANINTGTANIGLLETTATVTQVNVGHSSGSAGFLTIQNGGNLKSTTGYISYWDSTAHGTVTVTGTGSSWANSANLTVGAYGSGSLIVADSGSVSTGTLNVGRYANSLGSLTIESGGAVTSSGAAQIGTAANSNGSVIVTDAGSNLSVSDYLYVGSFGTGTLTVKDSGSVSVTAKALLIGTNGSSSGTLTIENGGTVNDIEAQIGAWSSTATGTATVTGIGSIWTNSQDMYIGKLGSGTLTVSDSGAVSVSNILYIAASSGSTGTLNIGAASGSSAVAPGTVSAAGGILFGSGTGRIVFNHTSSDYTFANSISGSGTIEADAGITYLTGDLSGFTGTYDLAGGTLGFSTSGVQTISNSFSGSSGTLSFTSGMTYLTSDSSGYTGTTSVSGSGILSVNGTLGGTVDVASGGTLKGSGAVGGVAVASGGTVAPGNSIGTLSVSGDVSFASGSTYDVEANATSSDKIVATGAATITGGTVSLIPYQGALIPAGTSWTILTAAGGVSGRFDSISFADPFLFLTATLSYDSTDVYATLVQSRSFASVAGSGNQARAAAAIESLGAGNSLYNAVSWQSDANVTRQAYQSLDGEIHANVKASLLEDQSAFGRVLAGRLAQAEDNQTGLAAPVTAKASTRERVLYGDKIANDYAAAEAKIAPTVWAQGFGGWGQRDGDANASSFKHEDKGLMTGVDWMLGDKWRMGLAFGYDHADYSQEDGTNDKGTADRYSVSAYSGRSWGKLSLRTGLTYAYSEIDTKRAVSFPYYSDYLKGSYNAHSVSGFAETAYAFGDRESKIEPYANLAWGYVNVPGFTEQGGAAALTAKDSDETLGTTTLGARVRQVLPFLTSPKNKAAFQASAGWLHTIGDVNPETSLRFAGGSSFKTQAAPLARDAAVVGAGVDYLIGDQTTLGVAYTGQIGDHADTQAVRGNVSYRF